MAVRLAGYRIRQCRDAAGVKRRATPGEPGHGKVETAPEQVDRADLADETRAEPLEDLRDRDKRPEKARDRVGIVGPGLPVVTERDRVRHLVGPAMKLRGAAERGDHLDKARVEFGNRHRAERNGGAAPVAGRADNGMIEEVECDLDGARTVQDGPVVSPRALTYSVACQEWLTHGVRASRYLPTICV